MKIIKYSTSNCAYCKKLSKMLKDLLLEVEEVELNTQDDIDFIRNMAISSVPVLIKYDDNGEEIDRIFGLPTPSALKEFIGG